ncbi:MAG: hypothetical protein C0618_08335 [Desulfuromonas sp.]|nr:MAG: hypothetical protein C0618_08335 [Desulfuromonas sp.]
MSASFRVFVFEDDIPTLELLTLVIQRQGYEVQGFTSRFSCPAYTSDRCECPQHKPCANAIIVNTRFPESKNLDLLIEQDKRGCKLSRENKAVMSASFSTERESQVREMGFKTIKKPFRLHKIIAWIQECEARWQQQNNADSAPHL